VKSKVFAIMPVLQRTRFMKFREMSWPEARHLERAITTDFALVRAAKADHFGNVVFRGGS
jgi:acyl CoA:acetate/3-ketoacid CoA transferase alpha subunit